MKWKYWDGLHWTKYIIVGKPRQIDSGDDGEISDDNDDDDDDSDGGEDSENCEHFEHCTWLSYLLLTATLQGGYYYLFSCYSINEENKTLKG